MFNASVVSKVLVILVLVLSSAYAVYSNYPRSIENVLISEGGSRYTNHPQDPGGPTKYGITLADVRRFINRQATANDVRNLTEAEAHDIYRRRYWDAMRGDDLPAGLDYTVFDYGVNSGIGRSGRVLRRVLGLSSDTWVVDDEVIEAVRSCDCTGRLINQINDERRRFVRQIRTYRTFGKGWERRIRSVRTISRNMAGLPREAGIEVERRLMVPQYTPGKAY